MQRTGLYKGPGMELDLFEEVGKQPSVGLSMVKRRVQ